MELERRDVLDHGFVRLVDRMGSDVSIARAARVSYDGAWRAGEDEGSDTKLIRYLWKNHHTTPFEAATLTLEVMAPIFIFRQWHRHRTQSYNELSARYRQLPRVYYLPNPALIGVQATVNKQGRNIDVPAGLVAVRAQEVKMVEEHCERAFELYEYLLKQGWPKELARMVLPLNVYSHMFATMNLLNLFKWLTLRVHSHAQYEIRVYADAILELIEPHYPVCVQVFRESLDEQARASR